MKKAIFLILFPFYLISATITINIAKDNNSTFSVVHIDDNVEFYCKKIMNQKFQDEIVCKLDRNITKRKNPLENRFFKIYFQDDLIIITPKHKFNYYPFSDSYIFDTNISSDKNKASKHWEIVGYMKNSALFGEKRDDILDFEIPLNIKELPTVGELDFELYPVIKNQDAKEINRIKESYIEKDYERVIKECDFFLRKKSNIFTSMAKLYKLRALDKLIIGQNSNKYDPMDFVDLSKEWIEQNPSDIHIPEVLSFIAKAYLKMNRNKSAGKYLNILNSEYSDSKFYFEAMLYKASKLYQSNEKNKAIKEYKEVLYNTKDFDIASKAAMYLTEAYLDKQFINKAKGFIKKIIGADPKYITLHPTISYKVAKKFAENNESNLSLELAKYIQKSKEDIDRDELDKNIAYWYEISGDYKKAIKSYRSYLQKHKNGRYIDFVNEHLDIVSLATKEHNQTKRLNYLDEIIKKYKDKQLSHKALLEKANILIEQKKYKEILKMANELKKAGGEKLLKEVAKREVIYDLKELRCQNAFKLSKEYNLTLPKDLNQTVYKCYLKLSMNTEAIKYVKDMLKSTNSIKDKIKWSYELVKLYKKMENYKALLLAVDDLEKLEKIEGLMKYPDICFDKVEAYYRIGNLDNLMLKEAIKCSKLFPNDVRNLDIFQRILEYAKSKNEIDMILSYAKKMIDLQKKYKISTYSPKLELTYIEALRAKKRYKEALDVTLDLLYKKLLDPQKAHVLYLAGYLSEKVDKKKEAKKFYIKCGEIAEDSAWVELCSENLELLDE